MKNRNLLLSLIATISLLLFNGCAGSAVLPNNATQTGAVTGALAGSVIGYNTKGSNKGKRAIIGGLLGGAIGAGVGSAVDSQTPQPQQSGGWQ